MVSAVDAQHDPGPDDSRIMLMGRQCNGVNRHTVRRRDSPPSSHNHPEIYEFNCPGFPRPAALRRTPAFDAMATRQAVWNGGRIPDLPDLERPTGIEFPFTFPPEPSHPFPESCR